MLVPHPTAKESADSPYEPVKADGRLRQRRMTITQRRTGGVIILDLEGRFTLEQGVGEFRDTVRALLDGGAARILLNYNLAYIDSAGLAELIAAYVSARNRRATIKIANLSTRTGPGLTVIKTLLAIFETYDDEAQALASFRVDGW
jgi:anti-anti-sigma factor